MSDQVNIILKGRMRMNGEVREPGRILLNGVTSKGMNVVDVDVAIQRGLTRAVIVPSKKAKKENSG